MLERGIARGFHRGIEGEAGESRERRPRDRPSPSRPHRPRHLHRRSGDARATSTTRSRRSRDGDGVRLWIHIADVAAYVRPGSRLDARGASTGDQRLRARARSSRCCPRSLSAGECSLSPGVERLRRHRRDRPRRERGARLGELLPQPDPLRRASRLRRARPHLRRRASRPRSRSPSRSRLAAPRRSGARGAAAVGGARGHFRRARVRVRRRRPRRRRRRAIEQTEAHRLIEQLMILTNERVAQSSASAAASPTLYRVHEQPDPDRVEVLFAKLAALDVPTPPLAAANRRPARRRSWSPRRAALVAARGGAARARRGRLTARRSCAR